MVAPVEPYDELTPVIKDPTEPINGSKHIKCFDVDTTETEKGALKRGVKQCSVCAQTARFKCRKEHGCPRIYFGQWRG
jgi:hypothetical protein